VVAGPTEVLSDGVPIDLAGTPRTRPFVCDWTGDGLLDVLVGAGDGLVRLYRGLAYPGDANGDLAVDGSDYTAWADHYRHQPVPACSDGGWTVGNWNEDDIVDGADYTAWADHCAVGGGAVAEPSTLALIAALGLVLLRRRGR
jgi:hypothetical protein